jgi:hypothetical protein
MTVEMTHIERWMVQEKERYTTRVCIVKALQLLTEELASRETADKETMERERAPENIEEHASEKEECRERGAHLTRSLQPLAVRK